jgi:acetyl-CoA carboxylase biotin carboxyl carrier protein
MAGERDGLTTRRVLTAGLRTAGDDQELLAPNVGLVRGLPGPGARIVEGTAMGELEILGVLHRLVAPAGTLGVVAESIRIGRGEHPVGWGTVLLRLVPVQDHAGGHAAASAHPSGATGNLVFRSPLSGRFYARPSPDKPPFVKPGDEITAGQSIALLEVMKTFNRLAYGGPGLPERARVKAVLAADESDVDAGTPLVELEAL